MNEEQWNSCTDPTPMLEFLRGKASDRKLRLFACACCRRVWHLLTDKRSMLAVEIAEKYADALASDADLMSARRAAEDASVMALISSRSVYLAATTAAHVSSNTAADTCRAAFLAVTDHEDLWAEPQLPLVRDIFGNPFRPSPPLPHAVLAWNDGTVRRIAQGIYEDRKMPEGTLDTGRLAILADALLDAGCNDEELIAHCRSEGPHVRGCYAIDLILGKS